MGAGVSLGVVVTGVSLGVVGVGVTTNWLPFMAPLLVKTPPSFTKEPLLIMIPPVALVKFPICSTCCPSFGLVTNLFVLVIFPETLFVMLPPVLLLNVPVLVISA